MLCGFTAVAVVLAYAGIAGCGKTEPESAGGGSQTKELLLYCGAGIRPPVDELVETFRQQYGINIIIDYAGSEVLLSKIKLTRRGDLYMPGDKYYAEQAAREGMILSQRSVCYFVPTILVQKGNPKNIQGLWDLLRPGLKLGLGDANICAVGRQARQIFAKNKIAWEDVEKNLVFQSLTVNGLGMQIQAGSLDAVIVWDAIAQYYNEHGEQVAIAAQNNVISTVDICILAFTRQRLLAESFVQLAVSERGQAIFKKHRYTIEPPN